jgi:hypothetical protein
MRRLLFALPALALLSSCGLLYAEVEIPSVTMTLVDTAFPPTPALGTMSKELDYDLGKDISLLTEKDVTFELRVLSMSLTLTSTSTLADFGSIQSVRMLVLPAAGQTLPEPAVLATYTRSPTDPHPRQIAVVGMSNLDLYPYLAAGALRLRFEAVSDSAGIIPAWTGDVGAEFFLKVRANYGKRL